MRMADLKMLHYKQIQYEFCSKECVFVFTRQQHYAMYDIRALYLYMNSIMMARYWDQMKAPIITTVCRTLSNTLIMKIYFRENF